MSVSAIRCCITPAVAKDTDTCVCLMDMSAQQFHWIIGRIMVTLDKHTACVGIILHLDLGSKIYIKMQINVCIWLARVYY